MKQLRLFLVATMGILYSITGNSQNTKTDYLSVPGPVVFEAKSYNLVWTSHPSGNYYKQEYLTKGENADRYKSMLMLEVLTGNVNVKDIVAGKIEELKKMKASNPIVNYEMFQKNGEYIIDFIVSANATDGKAEIVERNVYRYKTLAGQPGIILFAMSTRAYGNEIDKFLVNLKSTKSILVNAVAKFVIPAIKLTK